MCANHAIFEFPLTTRTEAIRVLKMGEMIEVFKTDVTNAAQAYLLKCEIRLAFTEYEVNFDLEDCDHILRVKSSTDSINNSGLILLLARQGFRAEVLPDDDVEASQLMSEHILPYKD